MPELAFFAGPELERDVVRAGLSNGAALIPDLNFKSPELAEITSVELFDEVRQRCRNFFITSPAYAESKLEVRAIVKNGEVVHYVFPLVGGPIIDISFPVRFLDGQTPAMRAGVISYYSRYTSSTLKIDLPAPQSLVSTYKYLRRVLADKSERMTGKKGTYLLERALKPLVREIRLSADMIVLAAT